LGIHANAVDLWEGLANSNLNVDIGSDQTSLHNPLQGGYYPAELSLEKSNDMMVSDPEKFKEYVEKSLRRQVNAINSV
jgi:urocanate hydratase